MSLCSTFFLPLTKQLAMLLVLLLVGLLGFSSLVNASGGVKSPARIIAQRLEQEPDTVVVEQQQYETPITTYYNPLSAYRFAYSTGQVQSAQLNQQEVAQHFREEQRDSLGYVTGKYGYIDPYGKLRVVNYRAGPDGYHAYGDVGPDQEVVRQQRLLYAHDQATRLQQDAWARYKASASNSAASSSSSASSGSDWTSISTNNNQPAAPSGAYKTTSSKYISSVRSPAAALRDYSTSSSSAKTVYTSKAAYTRPAEVSKTTTTTYVKQQPTLHQTTTYSRYVDRSPVVVPVKTKQYSYYYAIPSKTSSRYVAKTAYQSPTARLIEVRQQREELHQDKAVTDTEYASAASSSAASASASASASAAASSSSSASNYSSNRGNGQSQQLRSSRYTSPGRSVVNFKSFGPSPYQYSYSY